MNLDLKSGILQWLGHRLLSSLEIRILNLEEHENRINQLPLQ